MIMQTPVVILVLIVPVVLTQSPCQKHDHTCQEEWQFARDHMKQRGTAVHGQANIPVGDVQGTVHDSHVFGGPQNGAQTVGGGINYQHSNGLHGGVDVTHTRGQGNTVSATVGSSTKLGPGTLTVGGGATIYPGSSHIDGQVGATYSVPLP